MKKINIFIVLFSLCFAIAQSAFAGKFGTVHNVSPSEAKPGDILNISGENLVQSGEEQCMGKFPETYPCHFDTEIIALKDIPANPAGRPSFKLSIVSLTSTLIKAKIPNTISTGDGTYSIQYLRRRPDGTAGMDTGEFPITLKNTAKVIPSPSPSSPPSIKPLPTIKPSDKPSKEESPAAKDSNDPNTEDEFQTKNARKEGIFSKIINFIRNLFNFSLFKKKE